MSFWLRFVLLAPAILGLTGCLNILGGTGSDDSMPAADKPLSQSTQTLLALKGMRQESPIFVRIFKEESELEVWKLKDGRFELFRTYPICAWSGALGPKIQQGDMQAPEGFYTVSRAQMNPHSLYHLAFNIGFPNTYDRANGHTGSALMIHGNCKSAGCYAMTDAYIEEIYALAREAFKGGQTRFHVQALPFRMTAQNMRNHRDSPWYPFWVKLKEGYDSFDVTGRPPVVKVCSKQYLVNVSFPGQPADPAPDAACPLYTKVDPAKLPGIDGVPQTVMLANLKQPEKSEIPARAPAAPQPVIAVAAAQQQPASKAQPALLASTAEMSSASPVITRPAPERSASVIASMQPAAPRPAAPAVAALSPKIPAPVQPAPVRVAAAVPAQPPSYEASARPAWSAQAMKPAVQQQPPSYAQASVGPEASKPVDPDALQKPNRSGKGSKLSIPAAQATAAAVDNSGSMQSVSTAYSIR
jgi:murein L,D-transpeptidase YafK